MQMTYSGGYLGKLLRVNLGSKSVKTEAIDPRRFELLLGGRGVAAKYYFDEIPASTERAGAGQQAVLLHRPADGAAASLDHQVPARHPLAGDARATCAPTAAGTSGRA